MDPRLVSSAGYILSAVIGVIVGGNLFVFHRKKTAKRYKIYRILDHHDPNLNFFRTETRIFGSKGLNYLL